MSTNSKWGSKFWTDLAERVGATFIGALLAMLTLANQTPVDWTDAEAVWIVLGLPTVVALLKGLLINLKGPDPSPSLVGVTSTTSDLP